MKKFFNQPLDTMTFSRFSKFNHVVVTMAFMFVCLPVAAYGQWESATNTDREATNDPLLSRCNYQTIGGYQFSMTHRGICPFSVEVNPESGRVRTSQTSIPGVNDRWEHATNVGREATGDALLNRCIYQTVAGYRFSTNQRGLCPFTVDVNPETGKVKVQLDGSEPPSRDSGRWDTATKIGEERTDDPMLTRCAYQTVSGYRFSTTTRGLCRFSVQVNAETRQVK